MIRRIYSLLFLTCIISFSSVEGHGDQTSYQGITLLKLTSPAFQDNEFIPPEYTAEGKDVSPPLSWESVPKETRSLALICDDPDAPNGHWIHWILYNIPPTLDHIDEGGKNLPPSLLFGTNSWGNLAYNGPNPPQGVHHYHFTLYALDTILSLKAGATSKELHKAMDDHILETVTLTGLYERKG
jgi:Raf kinase inhibitor-like YbhB/YbcL family protein